MRINSGVELTFLDGISFLKSSNSSIWLSSLAMDRNNASARRGSHMSEPRYSLRNARTTGI
jgi:hypothetical protein